MLIGVGVVGWLLLAPQAEARTAGNPETGVYTVSAAPGLGYSYRWDENGDGQWDSEDFGNKAEVSVNLDVDQRRTLRLEVKNAFGRTATTEIPLERPKPDHSRAGPVPVTLEALQNDAEGVLRALPRAPGAPAQGQPAQGAHP
nr:MAG: hypothetical protein DIU78_13095 [Pseudomonadota bacterium]